MLSLPAVAIQQLIMIFQTVVLSVLLCSVHTFTLQTRRLQTEKSDENSGNTFEDEELSISELIEKANVNVGKNSDDPLLMFGDIVVPTGLQNADRCTGRNPGCLWRKASDGNVYVPYRISRQYSQREKNKIKEGLRSFEESTCIRFRRRNNTDIDFLNITSLSGCFSSVGRRGGEQRLSLKRRSCISKRTIQHELLHALGFHHEQNRSDRDEHVRIQLENVIEGKEHNFKIRDTNNLRTPYDYNSVMHYGRTAFSSNGRATIVPIPDENVSIGRATTMSANDILRVNRLYRCNVTATKPAMKPVKKNQVF
ncbi:high choriolytic enzyme 1-like isoform X2 [Acanthochromis polyacanthus]|uniref:high choriolytic enzyme 1-like isoform X2 n=1 Tax=Acanthochromis polyacanthus TaxID=80966 RepID=UPI00223468F6|nr:high choriolytic enzyme 1-like isoform X2 [Acanthochromis polyacanthus]XP_051812314.1 high choriolytic enzyme 1-like isoform X4 [Acanthochromis polyacanthus]XP_051812315.1 high choriolytic enzyme 1-like isoform X2 [Acanthochromis polyacanthus]